MVKKLGSKTRTDLKKFANDIHEHYKLRKKGLIAFSKGVVDTDGARKDSVVFNNFEHIRGAEKFIRILVNESKGFRDYFNPKEKVDVKKEVKPDKE